MNIDWRDRISIIGQISISLAVVIGFFVRVVMAFTFDVLPSAQRSLDTYDGALIGGFSAVIGFWLGSSSNGQKKDATIAAQSAAASAAVPATPAGNTPGMTATMTAHVVTPHTKKGAK